MKANLKSFNFWFNIFLIVGMIISLSIVELHEHSGGIEHNGAQRWKDIIISIGALMGVLNTVLSANGNIYNFLFGVIEVCICAYANWEANNLGIFYQHILYFLPMQLIGFWQWIKRGAGVSSSGEVIKVKARKLTLKQFFYVLFVYVLGTVICFVVLYYMDYKALMNKDIENIDIMKIALDSTVVMLNILGQILMSLAFVEQWYIWTAVNIFSIFLWLNRIIAMPMESFTIVMLIKYIFYLLNSLNGIRIWLKLSRTDTDMKICSKQHCC